MLVHIYSLVGALVLTYVAKTKRFQSTFNEKDLMEKIKASGKPKGREEEKGAKK
jgi:hypothetical protein